MSRPINLLVIHCSATPNGRWQTVGDINDWHRERGFKRVPAFRDRQNWSLDAIGYHFVIYTSGAVATGRHLDEIGAHAQGFNQQSLGICLIGTDKFSAGQWAALRRNVQGLQKQFPNARIVGHRDLPGVAKSCPGFDVAAWLSGGMEPLADHIFIQQGDQA
jgi:N-acetylmuramoyl-L-alanine amidase